jgi:hypothetical protein
MPTVSPVVAGGSGGGGGLALRSPQKDSQAKTAPPRAVSPPRFVDGEESICDEKSLDGYLAAIDDTERSFDLQQKRQEQRELEMQQA